MWPFQFYLFFKLTPTPLIINYVVHPKPGPTPSDSSIFCYLTLTCPHLSLIVVKIHPKISTTYNMPIVYDLMPKSIRLLTLKAIHFRYARTLGACSWDMHRTLWLLPKDSNINEQPLQPHNINTVRFAAHHDQDDLGAISNLPLNPTVYDYKKP